MYLAFTVLAEVIFLLAMQLIFLFCLLYVCFILCVSYFDVLPQNLAASYQRNIVQISQMPLCQKKIGVNSLLAIKKTCGSLLAITKFQLPYWSLD
jgi:hypothetical protein